MKSKNRAMGKKGFLSRLRRDEAGNTIAILAAAVIPAIGIVGGAVDISRVFIVRTNLQAACDAGALMGRRVMGGSSWNADSYNARTQAEKLFETNFRTGSYSTEGLVKNFTEANGKVTGTASVKVPMVLMSVFGIKDKSVSVTCDAEMRLPASDIMFVFDTTGSMNCPDDGSACPNGNNNNTEAANAKMKGLRKASSCFYEALTKQNIAAYDAADCGETTDPEGATSDVRLRFGFVPYSVNVNVGKLLPLDYMADQWTYQSREPKFTTTTTTTHTPTIGNESAYVFHANGSQTNGSNINNWTNINTNLNHSNGQTYSYIYQPSGGGSCVSVPNETRVFPGTNYVFSHQTPNPLVHPATTITKYYNRTDVSAQYLYQYFRYRTGGRWYCQLQYKTNQTKNQIVTFRTTTNVTWSSNTVTNTTFGGWTYKPVTVNVGALKNTAGNNWRDSLTLPLGDNGTGKTVPWNGCIEERKTKRITDNDPSDNWSPIPSDALDMDIEMAPTANADTKWGPSLPGAVYRKYKLQPGYWDYTTDNYETMENRFYYPDYTSVVHNGNTYTATETTESCPAPAKLYSVMDGGAFTTYLNSLVAVGNTYHDVGLLWGARLMAPEGIFKNVTADTDVWTERHMVFMTDGDTSAGPTDYSLYGLNWWDRRQNNGTSGPDSTWLEANVDARTQALCQWVRNENITLWVVAFGQGIAQATKDNLEDCATPGRYFEATNTAGLISRFKEIANTISALRLTN